MRPDRTKRRAGDGNAEGRLGVGVSRLSRCRLSSTPALRALLCPTFEGAAGASATASRLKSEASAKAGVGPRVRRRHICGRGGASERGKGVGSAGLEPQRHPRGRSTPRRRGVRRPSPTDCPRASSTSPPALGFGFGLVPSMRAPAADVASVGVRVRVRVRMRVQARARARVRVGVRVRARVRVRVRFVPS